MATIFTKIIKGEIPCYKIAENDKFFDVKVLFDFITYKRNFFDLSNIVIQQKHLAKSYIFLYFSITYVQKKVK